MQSYTTRTIVIKDNKQTKLLHYTQPANFIRIEHIDNDNVLLQLTVKAHVRDTTIKLASGTEFFIEEFDPYSFLETTFSRNKIVAPANIKTVLADEVQAIINDVKQYGA